MKALHELCGQGHWIRAIARELGISQNTARLYRNWPEVPKPAGHPARGSKLAPFREYILKHLSEGLEKCLVLLREIRVRGYADGYTILKDLVHPHPLKSSAAAAAFSSIALGILSVPLPFEAKAARLVRWSGGTGGGGGDAVLRDFFLGFIKIHILHHARHEPVYGSALIEELRRHGYDISLGTLYPTLHGLEQAGYLRRQDRLVEGKIRKYYCLTELGSQALDEAKEKIRELMNEVMSE